MNPVLRQIIESGEVESEAGVRRPLASAISPRQGEFLQQIIADADARTCLEVGLAYGISALFICDAISRRPDPRHIVIDPMQFPADGQDSWDGIGMANLRRAGYADLIEFHPVPAHRAIPRVEESGTRVDFAFIDGWHTFDHTLVDFFLVDRVLRPGGVVIIDDLWMPSVRKACEFILSNRSYALLGSLPFEPADGARAPATAAPGGIGRRLAGSARSAVARLVKGGPSGKSAQRVQAARCLAMRKEAADARTWDHFVEF